MKIKVPGVIYSLILAVGAWAIEYFTQGTGAGVPWAPILVAAVPILLKTFTVQSGIEPVASSEYAGTRGLDNLEPQEPKSKLQEWLRG